MVPANIAGTRWARCLTTEECCDTNRYDFLRRGCRSSNGLMIPARMETASVRWRTRQDSSCGRRGWGLAVEAGNTTGEGGNVNAGTGSCAGGNTFGSGWFGGRWGHAGRSVRRRCRCSACRYAGTTAESDRNSKRGCTTEDRDRRPGFKLHQTPAFLISGPHTVEHTHMQLLLPRIFRLSVMVFTMPAEMETAAAEANRLHGLQRGTGLSACRITPAHHLVGAVLKYPVKTAENVAAEIDRDQDLTHRSESQPRFLTHEELLKLAKGRARRWRECQLRRHPALGRIPVDIR